MLLLNTVEDNQEGFTQWGYGGDREAQQAMNLIGLSLERYVSNMVRSNMISICPVTLQDVKMLNLFLVPILPC